MEIICFSADISQCSIAFSAEDKSSKQVKKDSATS